MELQEPTLRALVAVFSWPNAPRYPDSRGAITELLQTRIRDADAWTWEGPIVGAWDDDERLHLLATNTGLDIVSEKPVDPSPHAIAIVPGLGEIINVTECTPGAVATWLLAAPDLGAASQALEASLASSDLPHVLEPLGGRPSRVHMEMRYETENVKTKLEVRPFEADDLVSETEFLSDLDTAELPPAGVIVRIQRSRLTPVPIDEAAGEAQRILEAIQRAGFDFANRLKRTP